MCNKKICVNDVEASILFKDDAEISSYMIGRTLRALRTKKGITQEQFAKAVGISLTSLRFYEENKWRPGMMVILRMAQVLTVPVGDIIGDNCKTVTDDNGDLLYIKNIGHGRYAILAKCNKQALAG